MFRLSSISLLCIGLITLSAQLYDAPPIPAYLIKKMNRSLTKMLGKEIQYTDHFALIEAEKSHYIFQLMAQDSALGYAVLSRAQGCKVGGCSLSNYKETSFEEFYYLTVFNKQRKIERVKVIEYTSDHGYEIANKGWLKQFKKGTHFDVGQNVDGISGATISVNSITHGINQQVELVQQLP